MSADILINAGSSIEGCEENYSCLSPFAVQIYTGQELTWRNVDHIKHFLASGTPSEGPDGIFYSNTISTNQLFSHKFDEVGIYKYFEIHHPWINGIIHVIDPPDSMNVTVINTEGSSTPGCEETNSCFIPDTVTVSIASTITWENHDDAMHTITSGSTGDGYDGNFDSGIMHANSLPFSHTFYQPGTYEYFCMLHPWMQGTVIVEEG